MSAVPPPLLTVRNLSVHFGAFRAVDGLDLDLAAGEVLGVVGESGSGKSLSMLALLGLVDAPGEVRADRLEFQGESLLADPGAAGRLLGREIAMVFQDALSSLNPCFTVGFQLQEVLRHHLGLDAAASRARALELLDQVEMPDARKRLQAYPHELSGGMNQRVMIAMAMACRPKLLIADEPTTALDVTVQVQIMDLLLRLQRDEGLALIMISHDLAVVAEMAQRVLVMYAGQAVEEGPLPQVFDAPAHPYTEALLRALPETAGSGRLQALGGTVPGAYEPRTGCLLEPRCPHRRPECAQRAPELTRGVRCHFPLVERRDGR